MKTGNFRRPGFETLEGRALLAGNVTATVNQNHVLVITGDDAGNFIEIRQLPPSGSTNPWPGARYQIINPYVPKNDTPTRINGQSSVIVGGVKNGITIAMKGGNDTVFFYRPHHGGQLASAPGNMNVDLGDGDDYGQLRIVNRQQTNIDLGRGSDGVALFGRTNAMTVVGDPDFQGGDPPGRDTVVLNMTAAGPVSVDTGYGNDRVQGKPLLLTSRGTLTVSTGDGNDEVNLSVPTASAAVSISTGPGDDSVRVHDSVFSGPLSIDTADGSDSVTLGQVTASADVFVTTGRGTDAFDFFDLSIDATLSAWLGEDADLLQSSATNHVTKAVFRGGDGIDTLQLQGNDTFEIRDVSGFETTS
jgi:hypothetical protein